jgi:transcriptional regulator with XRE-family HTH domain
MADTPQASRTLSHVMTANNWQQADLAKACGIDRATISHHINGARAIRDDHLAAYCTALDRTEQAQLVAAWLRDTLPPTTQDVVLSDSGDRIREDVAQWQPGLDDEQRQMLAWWSQKLATDRELDEIFRILTRRAGWQLNPNEKPTF